MERTTRARIILIKNCCLSYSTRLSAGISFCSAKYLLSYTLLNNIYISPPPRYACLCLYSLLLPRAEPSADCKAQTRLCLVIPTSSLTFFLLVASYFLFTFLAYGQHLARLWDRTLSIGPTITKCKRQQNNFCQKLQKFPFTHGGLRFSLLLVCRGYPQGRVVCQDSRVVVAGC